MPWSFNPCQPPAGKPMNFNFQDYPADLIAWIKALIFASFAAFGGLMGHLMRTIDKQQKIIWSRAILEGGAAGFVGFIVLMMCNAMRLSDQWTGVIVGVCGWLGANATIRMLEKVVLKKLGLEGKAGDPADIPKADVKE